MRVLRDGGGGGRDCGRDGPNNARCDGAAGASTATGMSDMVFRHDMVSVAIPNRH